MAASDVFGIVALLIAVFGAVYLFRTRVWRPAAPAVAARAATTLPPKLRPKDEPEPVASRQAAVASVPPPTESLSEPVSEPTIPSSPASRRARESGDRSSGTRAATPASGNLSAVPASIPPPSAGPPSSGEGPPSSGTLGARSSASMLSRSRASGSQPASARISGTHPSGREVSARDAKQTWSKERARPPSDGSAIADIPRIDMGGDEDEDTEPTRVGKLEAGGRPTRKEIQPPVVKIVVDEDAETPIEGVSASWAVAATAQTDTGKRRKRNEDSYVLLESHGVYVVADGMGGHRGGEHASKLAVTTIAQAFEEKRFEAPPHADIPRLASELARACQMANASILEEATRNPNLRGMGTTLCTMRFTDGGRRLYIAHVGDSRCYRVRDGAMKQLTKDHTMADFGVTGPEGAHLSRAVGVWPTVPIDILMLAPQPDDIYLLCSDGLTKMLPDQTIATQLLHEDDPKAAVDRLVFFANAHGGKDNITVVLLRVRE
jgi:PPM family protein phosphatase